MKKLIVALLALVLTTGLAHAQARIEVGRLSCTVDPGIGLIVGSRKDVTCRFIRRGYPTETYEGTITKVGLDVGITGRQRIEWLVFAATDRLQRRALAGTYVGGSSQATLGVGVGANWLVGGFRRSIALQPLSVQAQTGVNLSVAFAGLRLR